MTKPQRLDDLIVAILTEARSQDRAKMVKTALVKYIYMADVYAAEESADNYTLSRLPWRFIHFGPYSGDVEQAFDRLEKIRAIQIDRKQRKEFEGSEDEGHYQLFMLPAGAQPRRFEDINISRSVALRLRSDIRRYGTDVPRILDYVYFHTEPMKKAQPGAALDFSGCERRRPEEFQHEVGNPVPKKKAESAKKRFRELAEQRRQRRQRMAEGFGPYDEAYYEAMEFLGEHESAPEVTGLAQIDASVRTKDE